MCDVSTEENDWFAKHGRAVKIKIQLHIFKRTPYLFFFACESRLPHARQENIVDSTQLDVDLEAEVGEGLW